MSNSSIKKKEQPLNDTLYNLCKDLIRFIDRKIIKKYISPNLAQIPKEMRNNNEKKTEKEKENKVWKYFFKGKDFSEEEEIKDVFKDDKFLLHLQNLNNSLNVVTDYLEKNQQKIKRLEDDVKNKEEKLNSLSQLKDLLNNYFDENNENKSKSENQKNKNILEDKNLINIMNKIQSLNSTKNITETKISENIIDINNLNNLNNFNNNSKKTINMNINNNNINNNINNKINNNIDKAIHKKKDKDFQKENNNVKSTMNNKDNNTPKVDSIFDISNTCLSAPRPSNINNKEDIRNEPNSKDKNEIDILIDNFKINNKLIDKQIKEEKNEDIIKNEENYHLLKIIDKEEDNNKNNKFLNKKIEREKDINININEKEKEKINNNINNIQISILEKKKGKNKNKKINNITLKEKNNISNENSNQIPLKEEIANLPVLRPIIDKKKDIIEFEFESEEKDLKNNQKERNDPDLNEDVLNLLLEGYEDNNKYKDTNNKLSKNGSLELEFGEIINKEFSELNQKNIRTKVIKGILSSIKTNNIINYNPRINGPYLVGSYKTIPELPSINYLSPIDIMYTYKDILIDKKIIDYTINNIIKNYLNLNIIEKSESFEDDNKKIKIKVKCTNKINLNVIISFNIIFFDLEQNEKIINDIILDNETIIYENKEEHKKFINIILYLRVWRKKNKLFFIIPEIIDRIAKKHFDQNKNMGVVILNVFYDLYNGIIDFNSKINQGVLPKHKILMENIIKNWFNNEKNCEMIKKSILETNRLINNKNFHVLFNKEDI